MTADGLVKTEDLDPKELKKGVFKLKITDDGVDMEIHGDRNDTDTNQNPDYRYRHDNDSIRKPNDSIKIKVTETGSNTEAEGYKDEAGPGKLVSELGTPLSVFSNLFQ